METQTSTTLTALIRSNVCSSFAASFWLWRQPGRTWRHSDVGLCRSSLAGCKIRCLQSHLVFKYSLSLDLPTSSCPSALDSVPAPPGVASKHELVRSLNGLFLVPSVQMSDPVSEKPDTIGGSLSPGLFSFVGKSWLFKAEDQASYPPADVGEVSRHLFCPHGLVLPESHTAEQKHNQETQKNPRS